MPGPPGDRFVEVMKPFLAEAEKEVAQLKTRSALACGYSLHNLGRLGPCAFVIEW